MALGSDLLVAMQDLDDGVDTTAHSALGLRLLNWAQTLFERQVARRKNLLQTTATVATVASTETSALPTRTRRVDSLWMLDDNSRPWYEMEAEHLVGSHRARRSRFPQIVMAATTGTGRPTTYYKDSTLFYWGPVDPDAAYTVRVYGFFGAAALTSGGTFAYADDFIPVIAAMAIEPFRMRLEDPTAEHVKFALSRLAPVLDAMDGEWKHGSYLPRYSGHHIA